MSINSQNSSGSPDFSEAAATKAALNETIQHPLTLWPLAVGVVGGVGLGALSVVSIPVALGIGIGGFAIGAGNWALQFFGGKAGYMQKHYAELHQEFDELKQKKAAELADELKKFKCKQGQAQVDQLEEKFQVLIDVFSRVLNPQELTYSRFMGTVENIYRSGLENLERIVVLLTSVSDIDRDEVADRIDTLTHKVKRTPADERSLAALKRQADAFDTTHRDVEDLLARNEEALATMDEAGQAALKIKDRSVSQSPKETMADAMELLSQMIARANTKQTPSITLEPSTPTTKTTS
jgi:hypothetical protein